MRSVCCPISGTPRNGFWETESLCREIHKASVNDELQFPQCLARIHTVCRGNHEMVAILRTEVLLITYLKSLKAGHLVPPSACFVVVFVSFTFTEIFVLLEKKIFFAS